MTRDALEDLNRLRHIVEDRRRSALSRAAACTAIASDARFPMATRNSAIVARTSLEAAGPR